MYHFIGIKGSGMSSLAQIMFKLGYQVQGSDVDKHFFTEDGLREKGITILPYDKNNITKHMKIIKGASIKDDHEEYKKAMELELPIYTYHEMVGKLTEQFKTIGIAGCHGKTTTTAMLSHLLVSLKGANYLIGDGTGDASRENEYFVLEACEYCRHFLAYHPYYAIITNIDLDHVDYFKDIDDVINAYEEYANKAEKMAIVCGDDPYTHSLNMKKPIFYYGLTEDNDIIAKNIEYKESGTSFDLFVEENYYGHFDLPIYGKHQLLDAIAVISVCYYERISSKEVNRAFKTFQGAKRRFQEEIVGDNIIIDDYAHHPNEVSAIINSVKQKYPNKKIVAILQPHTFSRTKEFANSFAKILNTVDCSYILDIHPSREKQEDFEGVTSKLIIDQLDHGTGITLKDGEKLLQEESSVYVFMSPNDIKELEGVLKEKLEERENEM